MVEMPSIVEIWPGFLWPLQSIWTDFVIILQDVDALLLYLFDIIVHILHISVVSAILVIVLAVALCLIIAVWHIAGYAVKFVRPRITSPDVDQPGQLGEASAEEVTSKKDGA
jgi:hypothetical protein